MTATVIPAAELARRREERERLRQERKAFADTILSPLDDETDSPSTPASPAQKEGHAAMTDIAITEQRAESRGRGRPPGTGYMRYDAPLVEEVRQLIQPVPQVPTLRDAARAVAPRVHNRDYVTEDAAVRRIERYCRATFST